MDIQKFLKEICNVTEEDELNAIIQPRNMLDNWVQWYKGNITQINVTNNNQRRSFTRYTLGMANVLCSDWASMIINERTQINFDNSEIADFIIGNEENETGGVLGKSNFWAKIVQNIEMGFASGTVGMVARLDGQSVMVDFFDYRQFYPVRWDNNQVIECIIVSKTYINGQSAIVYSYHKKNEEGNYEIINRFYTKNGQDVTPDEYINPFNTQSDIPLFSLFSPNKNNNTDYLNMAYGVSILNGLETSLTAVDTLFSLIIGDAEVGDIKIIMTKSAIDMQMDSQGNIHIQSPYQNGQKEFVHTVDRTAPGQTPLFHAFNPTLQFSTQVEAMRFMLNVLSSKAGLGSNKYSFDSAGQVTATAMKVYNADQTRNTSKHRLMVERYIEGICKAIITLYYLSQGKSFKEQDYKKDLHVRINFNDTIFNDPADLFNRDRELVLQGLMTRRDFLLKHEIVNPDQVEAYIKELDADKGFNASDLGIDY